MPVIAETTVQKVTELDIYNTNFQWTLNDCDHLVNLNIGKTLESPRFFLTKSSQTAYLSFAIKSEVEFVLNLHLLPCSEESIGLVIKAFMIDREGPKMTTQMEKHAEGSSKIVFVDDKWELMRPKSVTLCRFPSSVPQQKVTVTFSLRIEDIQKPKKSLETPSSRGLSILKSFSEFYKKGKFCDITLIIGDDSVLVHSVVLAASSPYFYELFNKDKAEKEYGSNTIIDLTDEDNLTFAALLAFLEYVYGCDISKQTEVNKYDLLSCACKFGMTDLAETCARLISVSFTEKNIAAVLCLAYKENCEALKREALAFAKTCLKSVVMSDEFNEIRKNPSLIMDLF